MEINAYLIANDEAIPIYIYADKNDTEALMHYYRVRDSSGKMVMESIHGKLKDLNIIFADVMVPTRAINELINI